MSDQAPEKQAPAVVRDSRGRLVKGTPNPNPGGRPKALKDIEAMLTREHRDPKKLSVVFAQLLALALRGEKGDAAYMKLYLERVLGPVKDLDDLDELMRDAPPEVIEFLKKVVH